MALATRLTIVAFDPGGSTGIAWFTCVRGWNKETQQYEYLNTEYGCETLGPDKHHKELWILLNTKLVESDELHIIFESFEYRNKSRAGLNLISREYIGILELFIELNAYDGPYKCKIIGKKQSPATAMGFVTDKALKKLTVWQPGSEPRHMMDAYRHLFYYIIHTAKIMPEKFLALGWK